MTNISPRIRESLVAYAVEGRPTGDFLRAVLSNDLSDAVARADELNAVALPQIVAFVRNELPRACWGSPTAVERWLERKSRERAKVAATTGDLARVKRGMIAAAQVHAVRSESNAEVITIIESFCGVQRSRQSAIIIDVFRVSGSAPICAECVDVIETEHKKASEKNA
jgi:hypothetical protein